ncbi:MAG: hypothetical protein AAFZ11_07615 [Pseudomonadota bacterium]
MAKRASTRTKASSVAKKLDEDRAVHEAQSAHLMPSPEAATNLLLADIILRSASSLFRRNVERKVARASAKTEAEAEAPELIDGKTLVKTLALYGASKLATRSPLGLGVVAGSLALKTLYDRGKARRRRLAQDGNAQEAAQSEAGAS